MCGCMCVLYRCPDAYSCVHTSHEARRTVFLIFLYIFVYIYNRRYSTQYFLFCGVYIIYIYMVGWFGFLTEYICARNISVPRITLTRHPYGYQARHRSPICIHIYNIMHAYNVRQCVRTRAGHRCRTVNGKTLTFKFVL